MKKALWVSFVVLVIIAISLPVSAADFRIAEKSTTGAQKIIHNDLYLFGSNVLSAGEVQGDLVAAGGTVHINGDISEDALLAGGSISLLANVGDDVRAGGGNITISGKIGGDLVVGAGQINISGEGVDGDAVIGGGLVSINSPIKGNVKIGGGEILINAPIGGNVEIDADAIVFGEGAVVNGNLIYRSPKEITIKEGQVKGEIVFNVRSYEGGNTGKAVGTFLSLWLLARFVMLLAAALLLGLGFKRYAREIVESVIKKPINELGRGFLAVVAIPVASIILLITVIGMPLGFLGLVGFVAFMMVGWIFTPVVLGAIVMKWMKKTESHHVSWLSILLGVVIFFLLGLIPFVGWIIRCVLMLMTLGAIAKMKMGLVKNFR